MIHGVRQIDCGVHAMLDFMNARTRVDFTAWYDSCVVTARIGSTTMWSRRSSPHALREASPLNVAWYHRTGFRSQVTHDRVPEPWVGKRVSDACTSKYSCDRWCNLKAIVGKEDTSVQQTSYRIRGTYHPRAVYPRS